MNTLNIEIPKGYIIDKENSNLKKGIIKFKKQEIEIHRTVVDNGIYLSAVKVITPEIEFTIIDHPEFSASWDNAINLVKYIHPKAKLMSILIGKLIYENLNKINEYLSYKITKVSYWSSNEDNPQRSWRCYMTTDHIGTHDKNTSGTVRAVIW